MMTNFRERIHHFIVYDILGANDTPHRIALGVAIGVFIAFTPTMPFQMAATFGLSVLLGANKVVGLPTVWITNPATIVPIYAPQYFLGCILIGRSPRDLDWSWVTQTHVGTFAYAERAWAFMLDIFFPLWIGSMIIATLTAIATYYVTRYAIIRYRLRKTTPVLKNPQS